MINISIVIYKFITTIFYEINIFLCYLIKNPDIKMSSNKYIYDYFTSNNSL